MSLLFFENQGNDLLCAKGVVILDTGHLLTSHPTDFPTTSNKQVIGAEEDPIRERFVQVKKCLFFGHDLLSSKYVVDWKDT